MKGDEPTPFAEAAELRRLLQQLGHDGPPSPRDPAQESAREARLAANIDAELQGLVRAHHWRRRALFGFAMAAALVALMVGARHAQFGARSLSIAPEPTLSSKPEPPQSSGASPAMPAGPALTPSAPLRAASPASPATPPAVASARQPQSTLAEENQLFKEAAESARNGDVNGAVSRLERLLAEHPKSPLAQTALVRKFRLLAKAGRNDDARREAERYLAAYPSGFAVHEAQALQAAAPDVRGAP